MFWIWMLRFSIIFVFAVCISSSYDAFSRYSSGHELYLLFGVVFAFCSGLCLWFFVLLFITNSSALKTYDESGFLMDQQETKGEVK